MPETTAVWYRIRKTWSDTKSQIGAFHDLEKAKKVADGYPGYSVYDESGKAVYTVKELTTAQKVEKAVAWAEAIAADNTHGYDNTDAGRWGPDYACSSLIIQAFEQAGIPVRTAGATETANMRAIFLKQGFADVTAKVNLKTSDGLVRGDVLLTPGKHTELYAGSGKLIGARGDANSGRAENGRVGDQTGGEIAKSAYYNFPWTYALRFGTASKSYTVQAGSFTNKTYANNLAKKIKAKGLPAILKQSNGKWIVQDGVFTVKANADKLVTKLKKAGFDAIIK
ncbi:MAG: SPOR domain-containing protein [Lachnospiraceae bacterium]|nr:SPOR domain-containing protein [Lachnospiraceae bacterium]